MGGGELSVYEFKVFRETSREHNSAQDMPTMRLGDG